MSSMPTPSLPSRPSRPKQVGPATVYLVRHEATDSNEGPPTQQRLRGHKDLPLSEKGIADLKPLVKLFVGHPVKHVVTADLSRHIETGMAIAVKHGATLTPTYSFRPWDNTGAWGDRPIDKSLIREMQTHIDNPDKPLPLGPNGEDGGETFRSAYDRNVDGLQKVLDFVQENPDQPTAVVMSTRGIGAAIHYLYGDKRNIVGRDAIKTGGVIQLQNVDGAWTPKILKGNTGFFQPPTTGVDKVKT